MGHPEERARFDEVVLPHIDAAYNLARWLVRGNEEAQDLAQEAMLRAHRLFGGFRGGNPRAWLLDRAPGSWGSWNWSMQPELTVSPDGKTILYTQFGIQGSDLMMIENFR